MHWGKVYFPLMKRSHVQMKDEIPCCLRCNKEIAQTFWISSNSNFFTCFTEAKWVFTLTVVKAGGWDRWLNRDWYLFSASCVPKAVISWKWKKRFYIKRFTQKPLAQCKRTPLNKHSIEIEGYGCVVCNSDKCLCLETS